MKIKGVEETHEFDIFQLRSAVIIRDVKCMEDMQKQVQTVVENSKSCHRNIELC